MPFPWDVHDTSCRHDIRQHLDIRNTERRGVDFISTVGSKRLARRDSDRSRLDGQIGAHRGHVQLVAAPAQAFLDELVRLSVIDESVIVEWNRHQVVAARMSLATFVAHAERFAAEDSVGTWARTENGGGALAWTQRPQEPFDSFYELYGGAIYASGSLLHGTDWVPEDSGDPADGVPQVHSRCVVANGPYADRWIELLERASARLEAVSRALEPGFDFWFQVYVDGPEQVLKHEDVLQGPSGGSNISGPEMFLYLRQERVDDLDDVKAVFLEATRIAFANSPSLPEAGVDVALEAVVAVFEGL